MKFVHLHDLHMYSTAILLYIMQTKYYYLAVHRTGFPPSNYKKICKISTLIKVLSYLNIFYKYMLNKNN